MKLVGSTTKFSIESHALVYRWLKNFLAVSILLHRFYQVRLKHWSVELPKIRLLSFPKESQWIEQGIFLWDQILDMQFIVVKAMRELLQ